MTENEIKRRTVEIQDLIVQSCTRLNYLLQINSLAKEKNRIILRHPSLWAQLQRDFSNGAVLAVRNLIEKDGNTNNLSTYTSAIKLHPLYGQNKQKIDYYTRRLSNLGGLKIAQDCKVLSSMQYAHKQLTKPRKLIEVRYVELLKYLQRVGRVINQISGLYWGSTIVLHQPESEGDSFLKEYRSMEIAEIIGNQVLIRDDKHYSVAYAKDLLAKK